MLTGLKRIPAEHADHIYGSQLRATDQMLSVYAAFTAFSVILVNVHFAIWAPLWFLAIWTLLAFSAHYLSFKLRDENNAADYASGMRRGLLRHGLISLLHGAVWSAAMILLSANGRPVDIMTLWTIGCCLTAIVAIAFQATPLAASSFVVMVGGGGAWMLWHHADPLLAGVVTAYMVLLLGASLWLAHRFGVQIHTSRMLAEKGEVVSLLLKEHDVEAADWLWQTDAARRLTGVSPSFAGMFGVNCNDLEGRSVLEVLAGPAWQEGSFDPALHLFAEKLKQRQPFSDLVIPVTIQGLRRWWEISASPRRDGKGVFLGFRGVGSDITVQKETSERIARMARSDVLTKLPNRLHLTEKLAIAIENVVRWNKRCAFLLIDLDRFKSVNDTLGHLVGDQLLAQVAERIQAICSLNETCGRLGGDEFAIVIEDLADPLYGEQIAFKVIEAVSHPFVVDGHTLFVGASIGSAMAPQDGQDAETLMRGADLALYRAKDAGRGKHFRYAASMHADAEERRALEVALRDALVNDELHLLYQPIVDCETGSVAGFEALVRWTHPTLGVVSPARFIPIAEEAGLISSIGNWVLNTACHEARHWPENVRISVNVSPEQLYVPEFLDTIVSALAHSGLPASRLELEVTESVFLREGTGVSQLFDRIISLGIGLSLDDFGKGYSSLGYLSRTRFSTIKIDQSFVGGAARNQRESMAIIHAVVAMARSLNMTTTAEGVETEKEFELVRTMGCSKVQGFYFGRPMAAESARALFAGAGSRVA
ncbi:MAG TPA: EAL domain-containing protein [Sphingobium sp.]|nr:EAL domain-containing protein [Sphingobium sp.]